MNTYLDNNNIGQEDLILDDRWELEELDSDAEVKAAIAKKLEEAKQDKGAVPRTFQLKSSKFEEPLAATSPILQIARRTNTINRSKKHRKGLYDAVPEGTVLVKTTDATLTLKVPGQKETVQNKADVAKADVATATAKKSTFFAYCDSNYLLTKSIGSDYFKPMFPMLKLHEQRLYKTTIY